MTFALPSRAYDLQMLDRPADRARDQGWVYGLPPGISSEQWPLDPVTGFPLMHGFTLLLPEDYRVHGADIVALSFFGTPADHHGSYYRGPDQGALSRLTEHGPLL